MILPKEAIPLTEAQQQFVMDNQRLVYAWVNKNINRYPFFLSVFEEEDVISIAFRAMCRATQLFDSSRGMQFSTYVYTAMFNAVLREARQSQLIRKPAKSDYFMVRSMNQIDDKDEPLYEDRATMEEKEQHDTLSTMIHRCLRLLPDNQREVLIGRFFNGEVLSQIGKRMGITKERVRQIEADSLIRFKNIFQECRRLNGANYAEGTKTAN